jgi:hypothetical protein
MPTIYRSAFRTLIWLGEDERYTVPRILPASIRASIRLDQSTQRELEAANPHFSGTFRLLKQLADNEHLPATQESILDAAGLLGIVEFGWFERMWVVQETILSRDAYVVIGNAMLPWALAIRAVTNFITHTTTCCRNVQTPASQRQYTSALANFMAPISQVILSFRRVPSGTKNELLANLWMFRNRKAKRGHDKVYGILGLINDEAVTIEPDYAKSLGSLCRSVVLEDTRVSGNLHSLRGVRSVLGSRMIPSWATDWDTHEYWAEDRFRILTDLYKQLYTASGTLPARIFSDVGLPPRPKALGVAGRLVDHVVHATPVLQIAPSPAHCSHCLEHPRKLLRILQQQCGDGAYVTGGSIFSAFWRTLLGDCILPQREYQDVFYNHHPPKPFEPLIRRTRSSDMLAFLLWGLSRQWLLPNSDYTRLLTPESRQLDPPIAIVSMNIPAVIDIDASVARATSGRCMFLTSKGYIGLGPALTKVGDEVAILLGGTTPFMVRPGPASLATDDGAVYEILGDCYLNGCMDGELVKDQETDNWAMIVLV